MQGFSYTNTGPRAVNQDSHAFKELDSGQALVAVADGLGGLANGEVASQLTIDHLLSSDVSNSFDLEKNALQSHEKILGIASEANSRMATTLTAAILTPTILVGIHCGDSRAYILRRNGIKQLTSDHNEISLYKANQLQGQDESERRYVSRNTLYNAIGHPKGISIDQFTFDLEAGDRLIFSTDGFYDAFSKKQLRDLSLVHPTFQSFKDALCDGVNPKIIKDNCTFVVIEI